MLSFQALLSLMLATAPPIPSPSEQPKSGPRFSGDLCALLPSSHRLQGYSILINNNFLCYCALANISMNATAGPLGVVQFNVADTLDYCYFAPDLPFLSERGLEQSQQQREVRRVRASEPAELPARESPGICGLYQEEAYDGRCFDNVLLVNSTRAMCTGTRTGTTVACVCPPTRPCQQPDYARGAWACEAGPCTPRNSVLDCSRVRVGLAVFCFQQPADLLVMFEVLL